MSGIFWIFVLVLILSAALFALHILKGKPHDLKALSIGDSMNLTVNSMLLVLTIISLLIALAAFQDSKASGDEQQKALKASRDSLQEVVDTLKTQTALLNEAQKTLQTQLGVSQQEQQAITETTNILQGTKRTLKSQLDISTEQNKRELERLKRRPDIHYSFNGIPEEQFQSGTKISVKEAEELTLNITNQGEAALANPTLIIVASPTQVEVLYQGYNNGIQRNLVALSGQQMWQNLEPIAQSGTVYSYKLKLSIPDTVSTVILTFRTYGSNMPAKDAHIELKIVRAILNKN